MKLNTKEKYTIKEIKNAVDIVIGDDEMRSKEVIEILKQERENETIHNRN
jgi:hypothetical protein